MGTTSYISRMFGRSPVSPLQKHMAKVHSCVTEIVPFFEAVIAEDWEQVEIIQGRISDLEQKADVLKKALRLQLPKGIMLPVSRRDLLEVLTMQDRIANKTKDIAGLILGRKMVLPKVVANDYLAFVGCCVDAVVQARRAINELDELVETGFRGNEVTLVESIITELDEIEGESDRMQREIRARLFKIETELPAVEVVFLYKIIEWTGDLGDLAQRVGSRLQLMLAR